MLNEAESTRLRSISHQLCHTVHHFRSFRLHTCNFRGLSQIVELIPLHCENSQINKCIYAVAVSWLCCKNVGCIEQLILLLLGASYLFKVAWIYYCLVFMGDYVIQSSKFLFNIVLHKYSVSPDISSFGRFSRCFNHSGGQLTQLICSNSQVSIWSIAIGEFSSGRSTRKLADLGRERVWVFFR